MFGGMSDGFVVNVDPEGSKIDYSTYLGGSDRDSVVSLALDGAGRRVTLRGSSFSGNAAGRQLARCKLQQRGAALGLCLVRQD